MNWPRAARTAVKSPPPRGRFATIPGLHGGAGRERVLTLWLESPVSHDENDGGLTVGEHCVPALTGRGAEGKNIPEAAVPARFRREPDDRESQAPVA